MLGVSNVLVVTSCDRTLPCLRPPGSIRTSLLHPFGHRGGPFWWPGRSRFSSSQQAARVDLIGQARPPHARPATCTRIWPPERAGRAGTGSAQRPKSPVRAGPAGAAGRRGLGRPDWLPCHWPRPRRGDCMQLPGQNQCPNTPRATTHRTF